MVDTINELADLSRKLNQKSDQINSIISSINEKLAALNFGVEVWLTNYPIVEGDICDTDDDGDQTGPYCDVTLLGFCKFGERTAYSLEEREEGGKKITHFVNPRPVKAGWELAIKEAVRVDRDGNSFYKLRNVGEPKELLNASRETRLAALESIPRLLDKIKAESERLLRVIDAAEKAAEKF